MLRPKRIDDDPDAAEKRRDATHLVVCSFPSVLSFLVETDTDNDLIARYAGKQ